MGLYKFYNIVNYTVLAVLVLSLFAAAVLSWFL